MLRRNMQRRGAQHYKRLARTAQAVRPWRQPGASSQQHIHAGQAVLRCCQVERREAML